MPDRRRWLSPDKAERGALAKRWIYRLRRAGLDVLVGALLQSGAVPLSDHRWAWSCQRASRRLIRQRARPGVPVRQGIGRIELIGAPGVGKSTIARLLVERGGFRRLPKAVTDDEVAAASGTCLAFHAVLDRIENPEFSRVHGDSIRRRIAMLRQAGRERTEEVFVDDEGLLQRGLNLAQLKPNHQDFFDYYWTAPRPDLVVVVRADPAQICRRNHERAHKGPSSDRGAQRFFASWVADIAAAILGARGVPCAIVENGGTPQAGAEQILAALERLRHRQDRWRRTAGNGPDAPHVRPISGSGGTPRPPK